MDYFYYLLQKFVYSIAGRKHFSIYKKMMNNTFHAGEDRLTDLLSWASTSVPYYRDYFKGKVVHNIEEFPVIRKRDLQQNLYAFVNPKYPPQKLIKSYTGGSTGEPTNFFLTRHFRDIMSAAVWRNWTWAGWKPGASIFYIWGSPYDLGTNIRRKIIDFIHRKTIINAFDCNESDYREWVRLFNKKRPSLLFGYANALGSFSKYILDNNIKINRPNAIVTSTEILFPEVRQNIQLAFSTKVCDSYALREMWAVASECRNGKMHIFTDICYLETLTDEKGINHILLTTFDNQAMPLIRYDTDDTGIILNARCPCGSRFPVMNLKIARQLDFLVGPNGRRIDPYFAYYKMYDIQGVSKYQFLQKKDFTIELRIVKNQSFSDKSISHLKKVEQELKRKLSNDLIFTIKEVKDIQPSRTGKHKFIISELM